MGVSPQDAQEDAQRVVVLVAGSPVDDPAATPPIPAAEGKPVEPKQQQQQAAPAPAHAAPVEPKQGLQAMAVTVVRDVETGVDTSASAAAAGEKPSWFTPKRY
jgi:MFS transporter, Spinster family, sphingosine-1-phosphate transporter